MARPLGGLLRAQREPLDQRALYLLGDGPEEIVVDNPWNIVDDALRSALAITENTTINLTHLVRDVKVRRRLRHHNELLLVHIRPAELREIRLRQAWISCSRQRRQSLPDHVFVSITLTRLYKRSAVALLINVFEVASKHSP